MPRKLSRARCPSLIGSKAHMAAYKRPVTVPVRKRSTDRMPQHKHNLHFSLYSVRSKSSQISGKIEEQFQTLTVFRSSIQAEPMQCKHQIHRRKQQTLMRSQRRKIWEEMGKKFKGFEPAKKMKKNHRFISRFQARINRSRIRSKHSEDSNQISE